MGKYDYCVITKPKPEGEDIFAKPGDTTRKALLWMDGATCPGANYTEVAIYSGDREGKGSHVHDFDEFCGYVGTDMEHPEKLNAVIELYIGGELHIITESCLLFFPAGVPHGPMKIHDVTRPMVHFSGCGTNAYVREDVAEKTKAD